MGKRLFLIGLLAMLFTLDCYAQQGEFVRGRLIDVNTGEAVVFATVRVQNRAIGVISNMDGTFKVPLRFQNFGDTLEISCMGYVSKEVLLSSFQWDEVFTIVLEPAVEQLNEVIVSERRSRRNLSTAQILKRAIAAISDNYAHTPFSYVGYYRDYQLKENEYYNLNEAIMKVFDRGFGAIEQTTSKIEIYNYERNGDFPRDTISERPYNEGAFGKRIPGATLENYGGNEFVIMRVHDAVRNHAINAYDFVNRLDVDFIRHHSFELRPETSIGGERLFVIAFFRNEGSFWAEGRIYISTSDFSIHNLEYEVYKQEGKRSSKIFSKDDGNLKKILDIKLEYRKYQDIMYLNYLSVNNLFSVKEPPDFTLASFSILPARKCYELNFTSVPKPKDAQKINRYEIVYQGKKSTIEKVEVSGRKVFLFPELEFGSMEYYLFSKAKDDESYALFFEPDHPSKRDGFQYNIRNLEDVNGQKFNETNMVEVNQFREFFVQEVNPGEEPPTGILFMNKNRPLFSDQPISSAEAHGSYWMNTPLQQVRK